MKIDIRSSAARFYDVNPEFPNDIPFYLAQIPRPEARLLELGCGSGRVSVALAPACAFLYGLDLSAAMLELGRAKLAAAGIPPQRARLEQGDITAFDLGQTFDLIIAPFRVLQNLETDAMISGLLGCIRRHLAPGGAAILNAFRPRYPPDEMRTRWRRPGEQLSWSVEIPGGRVAMFDRLVDLNEETLALYPELIYRRYETTPDGERLAEEAVLPIVMRCYYPGMFEALIESHGFRVTQTWGGYAGEVYGQGPELVVKFQAV